MSANSLMRQLSCVTLLAGSILPSAVIAQQATRERDESPPPCRSKVQAACEQVARGIATFRQARFEAAIQHFTYALAMDPEYDDVRLYLGTAYAQRYVPGGEAPENVQLARKAIEVFEELLKRDPRHLTALANIAQLHYNLKEFEKSKEHQRRRIAVNPDNPDPYFWIGVINWAECYPRRMQVRRALNIGKPTDAAKPGLLPPLPEAARAELAAANLGLVEEGIESMEKALELQPESTDAMTYLNLLYRERADLQENESERIADLARADQWVEKALERMKKRQAPPPEPVSPD